MGKGEEKEDYERYENTSRKKR
jgi:hypothetical protein